MKLTGLAFFIVLTFLNSASAQWIKQSVNTTASFRGLSVVSEKIVWASGTGGTVIKTIDGGKTWTVMTVPGAEKLDFRDIEAFDANTAYILSIGNGESSRIYKTTDGGKTWNLQFTNKNEKAFFDAIACWSRTFCLAMSDPVEGRFLILSTVDGGSNWKVDSTHSGVPESENGEAAFAASGTCIISIPGTPGYLIVTGGNAARVMRGTRRTDGGLAWRAFATPIVHGTSGSGIFSIAMSDSKNGVIVGGNYEKPNEAKDNLAFTNDGGMTWAPATGLKGYRSGVAYIDKNTIIAVGTNGTDLTTDGGKNWYRVGSGALNSVASSANSVWAVGPAGSVVELGPLENFSRVVSRTGKKTISDPADVTAVTLNRSEVSSKCLPAQACDRTIQVSTTAPDVEGLIFIYTVSGGLIFGEGPSVVWDLSGVKPGKYTLTAAVDARSVWGPVGKTYTTVVTVTE